MRPGRDRKRVLKAARGIPVEQIRELLRLDEETMEWFVIHNAYLECDFIRCWHRMNGMMTLCIEDGAVHLACIDYMKNHGYLQFESDTAASAFIKAQGWTCSRSWPGKT